MSRLALYINQQTKDLETNSKGQLVNMNSLLTEIYMRLITPLGSYRYDTTFGSVLQSYIQNRRMPTINSLKTAVANALLPMVKRGSIVNVDFLSVQVAIGAFSIQLNVTDSDSNNFVFPYSVQG